MSLQVSAIMLGVKDLDRAKKFYAEGLGCEIDQDFPGFVRCRLGEGSSMLALYQWEAAAQDAGVSAEGSGFRGVSFHFITNSREEVDAMMQTAAGRRRHGGQGAGRRRVGRVLRLLRRPGRLPVEGDHRRLTADLAAGAPAGVPAGQHPERDVRYEEGGGARGPAGYLRLSPHPAAAVSIWSLRLWNTPGLAVPSV